MTEHTPRSRLRFPGADTAAARPELLDCQVARLHLEFGMTVTVIAHLVTVDGVPEMLVDLVDRHVTDQEAASYRFV